MRSPGFFRHMAIIVYDSLLLLALLFLAIAIALPLNKGEAITSGYIFPLYLLAVSFFYYGWFWTHGGQTLGMKTWKVKVRTFDNQAITWKHVFVRFFAATLSWIVGLGFIWKIIDKKKRTWHDHISKTALFFEETL